LSKILDIYFNFFQAGASTLSEIQEEYGELIEWLMQKTQYLEHHMQTKTISMDYNVSPQITQSANSNMQNQIGLCQVQGKFQPEAACF
jgi:hypothetical protein